MDDIYSTLAALYDAARDFCSGGARELLESKRLLGEYERPVMGEGAAGGVLLIGEAPGREETEAGRPFVGKAGKTLDSLLEQSGIERGGLYITNTVKYRPYKLSARGTKSNRPPARAEIALFSPLLFAELALIRPRLILTLGNTPLFALTGGAQTITQAHGRPVSYTVSQPEQSSIFYKFMPPSDAAFSATLIPLYHPASAIYDRSKLSLMQADMLTVSEAVRTLV